jgi:hypothetical protein
VSDQDSQRERDDAKVDRFLDGLDDRRDEIAKADEIHRSRAARPPWEYMTWTTTDTKSGRSVRLVNGERLEEYPLEYAALVEAGEQGWQLVSVVAVGSRQDHTLYFKRPKVED